MATRQIKIYAGSDTYEKWQQICARFSSNTAAFAVMVENYYNQTQEDTTMVGDAVVYETDDFIVINGQNWGMPGYYYQIGNGVYDDPIGPFDTIEEAIKSAKN